MTEDSRKIVARGMAENMSIQDVLKAKRNTKDGAIREELEEYLSEESVCPDCANDLLYDQKEEEYYCPVGCFSVKI